MRFGRAAVGAGVASVIAVGCVVGDVELTGKRCPCVEGWQCDARTSTCVRTLDQAASDAPFEIELPDRLTIAVGQSATLSVKPKTPLSSAVSVALDGVPQGISVTPALAEMSGDVPAQLTVAAETTARTTVSSVTVHAFRSGSGNEVRRPLALDIVGNHADVDTGFGDGGLVVTDQVLSVGWPAFLQDGVVRAAAIDERSVVVLLRPGGSLMFSECSLARYDEAGALDPTFGVDGRVAIPHGCTGLAVSGGAIVVAGTTAAPNAHGYVMRLDRNGAPDPAFHDGQPLDVGTGSGDRGLNDVAIDAAGRIVAAGYAPGSKTMLARITADGALDPSFGTGGVALVGASDAAGARALAIDAQQRIVVAGWITVASTTATTGTELRRLDADGKLDATYGASGVNKIAIPSGERFLATRLRALGDGAALLCGEYKVSFAGCVRLASDGTLDPAYGAGAGAYDGAPLLALYDFVTTSEGGLFAGASTPNDDLVRLLELDGRGAAALSSTAIRSPSSSGTPLVRAVVRLSERKLMLIGALWNPNADGGVGDARIFLARYWL